MAAVGAYEDVKGRVNGQSGRPDYSTLAVDASGGATPSDAPATNGVAPATVALGTALRSITRIEHVRTERHLEFVDVTDHVKRCLAESGVHTGFAVVFSRHTTAGIRINEHEPLLLEDMARLLEALVPQEGPYRHDDFAVRTVNLAENERVNGHSHCRSLLLGASETVPVAGGALMLGRWQRIFLVDLDGPNTREFVIQVIGV